MISLPLVIFKALTTDYGNMLYLAFGGARIGQLSRRVLEFCVDVILSPTPLLLALDSGAKFR